MLHQKLKTVIILVLILTIVIMYLPACNRVTPYPILTDEQQKMYNDIAENYVFSDYNLFFVLSGDWIAGELSVGKYNSPVVLATIHGIGDLPYIAGFVEDEFITLMGGYIDYGPYVLQHKDAPNPLTDWTISDIQICCGEEMFTTVSDGVSKPYALYESAINTEKEPYYSWAEAGSDSKLVDDIRNTLHMEPTTTRYDTNHVFDKETRLSMILCIHFEESDSLVWISPLRVDADGYGIFKYEMNPSYPSDRLGDNVHHLGDRWDAVLEDVFHNMAKYETQSESGSATQESSESESVPVESENALQEMS